MRAQLKWIPAIVLAFLVGGELFGQGQAPAPADETPSTGWHRFGDTTQQGPPPPPMELTLPSGTWITVRVDQLLSSDRNQQGDVFTATLSQPLVANGLVIARRGQTVAGVVASAEKAGRVKGTSSLRLELTELSLVDGRQVQVKTTLMERRGNTSVGRDAAAIGTATGVGAMIGLAASCGYGYGAGIGAIAGAAASTIGVLVTRGLPTVVYPEDMLAFRTENPRHHPGRIHRRCFSTCSTRRLRPTTETRPTGSAARTTPSRKLWRILSTASLRGVCFTVLLWWLLLTLLLWTEFCLLFTPTLCYHGYRGGYYRH